MRQPPSPQHPTSPLPGAGLRRLVRALHRSLRDGEGNSSLLERFDELAKLLYCKSLHDRLPAGAEDPFAARPGETDSAVASRVRALLVSLVRRRPGLFPPRFATFRLADATLARLADILAGAPPLADHADLAGLAFEEVIRDTFDKGDNQQFFTPRPVVEFMVRMLGGAAAGLVCDPACGTGGFLLGVHSFLRQTGRADKLSLLGFEVDERLAWVAGINLDLHGAADWRVRHLAGAGSLGPEVRPYFGTVDAIVTNPPFGSDLADREALAHFELGRGRASRRRGVLFLERCLDLLRPGGALAIVLDDGVLNSPSNSDARRLLLERARLLAVVSLPETAFMPYATVKASILFLEKKGGPEPAAVDPRCAFFARAEAVGRKPNGDPLLRLDPATNRPEVDSDLPDVLREWERGPGVSFPAAGRGFWARVPDPHDPAFASNGYRLDLAFHHPARQEASRALHASPYPLRTLAELCDLRQEVIVPARDLPDEELTYLGLANIEAHTGACTPAVVSGASLRSSVRRFAPGDVLFAKMRPELRKVCLVPAGLGEGYTSAECLVLVPKTDPATGEPLLLPELLAPLLRSDLAFGQLVHLVVGIGRPRLSTSAVLNVRLPCPPPQDQRQLLEDYRRSEQDARTLFAESERAAERARSLLLEARTRLVGALLHPSGGA